MKMWQHSITRSAGPTLAPTASLVVMSTLTRPCPPRSRKEGKVCISYHTSPHEHRTNLFTPTHPFLPISFLPFCPESILLSVLFFHRSFWKVPLTYLLHIVLCYPFSYEHKFSQEFHGLSNKKICFLSHTHYFILSFIPHIPTSLTIPLPPLSRISHKPTFPPPS